MNLQEASVRANEVRQLYSQLEERMYGRHWSTQELMLGFLGDVGDLAKLIQAAEGVRDIEKVNEKLSHEFADCLWSLLVLAQRLHVDIEQAFEETMTTLETHIRSRLAEHE